MSTSTEAPNPSIERMSGRLMHIREAKASESQLLSALARQAKAHWLYSPEQIEAWRSALTLSPQDIIANPTFVAEGDAGVLGFVALAVAAGELWLEHLWVSPHAMGQGVGRALVRHAITKAADMGHQRMLVESDPHAEGFYLALGARRVGSRPAPIAGNPDRSLPRLVLSVEPTNPSIEEASQGRHPCAASPVTR